MKHKPTEIMALPWNEARIAAFLIIVSACAPRSRAEIEQPEHGGWLSLSGGGVGRGLGQTFTADASVQSLQAIQWWYEGANQIYPAANVLVSLYEGDFISGSLINQTPVSFADGMPSHWVNTDFSGINLSPGSVYSFSVLSQGNTMQGGVGYSSDRYAGGSQYWFFGSGSSPSASPANDMAFRVIGVVPEPSTPALLILACVGWLTFKKRRKEDLDSGRRA